MPTPLRPNQPPSPKPAKDPLLTEPYPPKTETVDTRLAKRNKTLVTTGYVILLLVIAALGGLLYVEQDTNRQIEAQSAQALDRFLKNQPIAANTNGTSLLIKNMRFCWSQNVCVNTDLLTAQLQSLAPNTPVVFDNPNSFMVNVGRSDVMITPKTMEGMFNESVFNYPGSKLRNLTVEIKKAGKENLIKLDGSLKYILWIPFTMDTNLKIDKKTNTLVISVQKLRVFGILPATWLIHFKPFNLDKMLTLPKNKHLTVNHNLMMVKPFGLFPPPRINGVMQEIVVGEDMIRLSFAQGKTDRQRPMPVTGPRNFIYLDGGDTQFGKLGMRDTQIEVIEKDPGKLFQFSLLNYADYLPASQVKMLPGNKVVVYMPNHTKLPEGAHAKADAHTPAPKEYAPSLKQRVKSWFGDDKPDKK